MHDVPLTSHSGTEIDAKWPGRGLAMVSKSVLLHLTLGIGQPNECALIVRSTGAPERL